MADGESQADRSISSPSIKTMRALQLVENSATGVKPASLQLTDLTIPKLKLGHLLVKIHSACINPSDIINWNGGFSYTTYPRVPGRDFAGLVHDGPPKWVGRNVFGSSGKSISFTEDGTHAEYCLIPEAAAVLIPSTLSFAQAACIGVSWSTASVILKRACLQPSDSVLVLGASGAVGSSVVQLAKARGCKTLTAARWGTSDVDLSKDPGLNAIKSLTSGKGVDVVVDTTGDPVLMHHALKVLAVRGRLAYVAAPRTGSTSFSFDMKALYRAEHSLVGCNSLQYTAEDTGTILRELTEGFENGSYKVTAEEALHLVSIDEAAEAYRAVHKKDGRKFIITM